MLETTHYKLKKPQLDDFANIEEALHFSMDTIDTALAGKPDADGGDISKSKVKTITAQPAIFPSFAPGEAIGVIVGKIKKYLDDLKSRILKADTAKVFPVTLEAWSASAPYTQRVTIPGMSAADQPIISHAVADGVTDGGAIKEALKAYGCVDKAETGDGFLELTCYRKKPGKGFYILVKGVV